MIHFIFFFFILILLIKDNVEVDAGPNMDRVYRFINKNDCMALAVLIEKMNKKNLTIMFDTLHINGMFYHFPLFFLKFYYYYFYKQDNRFSSIPLYLLIAYK